MERPIERLVWAYACLIRRQQNILENQIEVPDDFKADEESMRHRYEVALQLRAGEVMDYAKRLGVLFTDGGLPLDEKKARNCMSFMASWFCLNIERKRVGDEFFYDMENMLPPPEPRKSCKK